MTAAEPVPTTSLGPLARYERGGKSGAGAAQGDLFTEVYEPGKS